VQYPGQPDLRLSALEISSSGFNAWLYVVRLPAELRFGATPALTNVEPSVSKPGSSDPLTCPKCQGEMRIISFIDQPDVIKKIPQHLGLWEESHAPPDIETVKGEITFDSFYSQLI
jgi:hypothetical protein